MIGVNTHRANRIVEHALNNKLINEFNNIKTIKPEFKFEKDTRFDFLCDNRIIEVKNVTLNRENNVGEFPDAVTSRGSKHLVKLINSLKKGFKPPEHTLTNCCFQNFYTEVNEQLSIFR